MDKSVKHRFDLHRGDISMSIMDTYSEYVRYDVYMRLYNVVDAQVSRLIHGHIIFHLDNKRYE